MNNSLIRFGTALMMIVGLSTSTAYAGRGHGEGHGGGFRMIPEKALKKLNLSAEQEKKLKEIRESGSSEFDQLQKSVKDARQELKTKMTSENASDEELRQSFSKLDSKQSEMRRKGFERMLQIRSVLNPAQRKQLADMIEKRASKMKDRKGRFHADDEE